MSFSRIVNIHPAWISGIVLALAVITYVNGYERSWPWAVGASSLTQIAVFVTGIWIFECARLSANRLSDTSEPKDNILFWLTATYLLTGAILSDLVLAYYMGAYEEIEHNLVVLVLVLVHMASFLILAWRAAALISRAEVHSGKNSSAFVTFLLLLYLFLGVWILKRRVLALQNPA